MSNPVPSEALGCPANDRSEMLFQTRALAAAQAFALVGNPVALCKSEGKPGRGQPLLRDQEALYREVLVMATASWSMAVFPDVAGRRSRRFEVGALRAAAVLAAARTVRGTAFSPGASRPHCRSDELVVKVMLPVQHSLGMIAALLGFRQAKGCGASVPISCWPSASYTSRGGKCSSARLPVPRTETRLIPLADTIANSPWAAWNESAWRTTASTSRPVRHLRGRPGQPAEVINVDHGQKTAGQYKADPDHEDVSPGSNSWPAA